MINKQQVTLIFLLFYSCIASAQDNYSIALFGASGYSFNQIKSIETRILDPKIENNQKYDLGGLIEYSVLPRTSIRTGLNWSGTRMLYSYDDYDKNFEKLQSNLSSQEYIDFINNPYRIQENTFLSSFSIPVELKYYWLGKSFLTGGICVETQLNQIELDGFSLNYQFGIGISWNRFDVQCIVSQSFKDNLLVVDEFENIHLLNLEGIRYEGREIRLLISYNILE